MTESELALITRLSDTNPELRRLYSRHCEYEERLDELKRSRWQSPEEYAETKKLKRAKLAGRDRMASILAMNAD
ncbi:MAG: DUF465 domain-containing protein [Myxococcota bacterium]|nr:DUF465 domain-containing protein [Myxococcota bacterium]